MRRIRWLVVSSLLSCSVQAQELEPIFSSNLSPTKVIFLQPTALFTDGLENDQWKFQWHLTGASHSVIQTRNMQRLELDGETWRLGVNAQKNLNAQWSVRFEIPFVSHSGGVLDHLIDRWHQISGLSDGQRDVQPRDRLLVQYNDSINSFEFNQVSNSLGDINFAVAYGWNTPSSKSSLQFSGKLPTGDSDKLSGSGAADGALTYNYARRMQHARRNVDLQMSAGVIYAGTSDLNLPEERNAQWTMKLHAGFEWFEHVFPEVQLRFNSAPFDGAIPHLSRPSVGIDLGVQWASTRSVWKLGITEDVKVDSEPDFGLYLNYRPR